MKKLPKILINILGCTLLLAGCKETNETSNNKLDDDIIPIEDVVIEDDDEEEDVIVTKTCKEISNGTSGGSLTDFAVGSYIEPNSVYYCTFSHTHSKTGEYTVKSDDRTIAQVSHEAGTSLFTVKGITPGDAIIEGTTDEGEVVLRFVVHVRKRIPMNKIAKELYKTPMFYGVWGFKLSFLNDNPLTGHLTGKDDYETSNVRFTLTDGVEERIQNGTDFNTYKFTIRVDSENSVTSRTYTYLYVSTTGERIYMYYTNGLVDMFTNTIIDIKNHSEEGEAQ